MARATDRTAFRKEAERTLPHRVDVLVPEGGLGRRITEMHDWCRDALQIGAWAMHGHSESRKGAPATDYLRFHFRDESAAVAFRQRWGLD
jgi:hypothetical protein